MNYFSKQVANKYIKISHLRNVDQYYIEISISPHQSIYHQETTKVDKASWRMEALSTVEISVGTRK